jgi:hypothetical protein
MIKDAMQFIRDGWTVYSNVYVNIPHRDITEEEILNLDKYSEIHDCVLMIDEIQIMFDSRRSMKSSAISFSAFIQQIRKRRCILLCTTQYTSTVDVRLRQHVDVIARPRHLPDLKVCEVTYTDMTTMEDAIMEGGQPQSTKIVYDATTIYPYYETRQLR